MIRGVIRGESDRLLAWERSGLKGGVAWNRGREFVGINLESLSGFMLTLGSGDRGVLLLIT